MFSGEWEDEAHKASWFIYDGRRDLISGVLVHQKTANCCRFCSFLVLRIKQSSARVASSALFRAKKQNILWLEETQCSVINFESGLGFALPSGLDLKSSSKNLNPKAAKTAKFLPKPWQSLPSFPLSSTICKNFRRSNNLVIAAIHKRGLCHDAKDFLWNHFQDDYLFALMG